MLLRLKVLVEGLGYLIAISDTLRDVLRQAIPRRRLLFECIEYKDRFGKLGHIGHSERIRIVVQSQFHYTASQAVKRLEAAFRCFALLHAIEIIPGVGLHIVRKRLLVLLSSTDKEQRLAGRITHVPLYLVLNSI